MITTRQINVNLDKGRIKLRRMTTRDVDASIVGHIEFPIIMSIDEVLQEVSDGFEAELPKKKSINTSIVSTTNLTDVTDTAEKKRRDEIMAERKAITDVKLDEKGLDKFRLQFVFADIDGLIQAVSRRELK